MTCTGRRSWQTVASISSSGSSTTCPTRAARQPHGRGRPDGKLYISVGSTCNACSEANPENATILRVEPDGSSRQIFASGLRNTIGYGFEPATGELYGMDHGIDWLGDAAQPEELNHIVEGHKYGWPYVYADSRFNPQDDPPGKIPMSEWAAQSAEPVGLYTPHAAPMQLVFYTGSQFPHAYRGDAFVAMHGSWNRKPPSGYEVLRIHFENGRPVTFEPFVTGFLTTTDDGGFGQLGRPVGLAMAADGSLLMADDSNGVIYRIGYEGGGHQEEAKARQAAPAAARPPRSCLPRPRSRQPRTRHTPSRPGSSSRRVG